MMHDSGAAYSRSHERGATRGLALALCIGAALLLALLATWYVSRNESGLRSPAAAPEVTLAPLVAEDAAREASRSEASEVRRNAESSEALRAESSVRDPDLDLHGVVVDTSERGIAGARVAAIAYPWRRSELLAPQRYGEERVLQETTTAGDGSFRLRLVRGASETLRVEATGFARREIVGCQAGERMVVVLSSGHALEIFVHDEAGDGVSGAKLRFWRRDDLGSFDARTGETQPTGICRFEALEAGHGTLECVHGVLGSPGWKQVQIGDAAVTRFDLLLPVGRTLRGTVTDASTQRPIEGARVGENWVLGRAVTTAADGSYELPGWTGNGVDDVHVIAEGYGRQGKTVPKEGPIDFQLVRGDVARGRIVSAAGAPIAGALVSAVASKHLAEGQEIDTRATTSAADGRFELTSLRRDLPHTLIVLAEGHGRMLLDFDPAPNAAGSIELGDLVLSVARSISGLALDADGTPLARARIGLVGHNADRARLRIHTTELAQTSYGNSEERFSDDRGRFRFPDLSPGNYRLTLKLTGAPEVAQTIALGSERDLDGVELRLPAGKGVSLLVVDSLSAPIAGAYVSLHCPTGQRIQPARTSSAGTCRFRSLPETELSLSVTSLGEFLPAPDQTLVAADQELRIVLERRAYLKGSVVDAQGAKQPHLEIEAVLADGSIALGAADERGEFSVRVAHGERYLLRLSGERRRPHPGGYSTRLTRWRGELDNVFAPAEGLVLRATEIAATGVLDVRVEDAEGRPFPNAEVWVSGGGAEGSLRSDAAGKVRFENLLEGRLLVHAEPPPDPARPYVRSEQLEVATGAPELVLRLRRSQKIEGQVLRPDGQPASGVRVSLRGDDVIYAITRTNEAGRFQCIVEPAPLYWIEAEHSQPGEPLLRGKSEPFAPSAGTITVHLAR